MKPCAAYGKPVPVIYQHQRLLTERFVQISRDRSGYQSMETDLVNQNHGLSRFCVYHTPAVQGTEGGRGVQVLKCLRCIKCRECLECLECLECTLGAIGTPGTLTVSVRTAPRTRAAWRGLRSDPDTAAG